MGRKKIKPGSTEQSFIASINDSKSCGFLLKIMMVSKVLQYCIRFTIVNSNCP